MDLTTTREQHRHPLTAVSVTSPVASAVWATLSKGPPPPRTARPLLTVVGVANRGVQAVESRSAAPARGMTP